MDANPAKFYVINEAPAARKHNPIDPLDFEDAFAQAAMLANSGRDVHVLYTDGASEMQITRMASLGIQVNLAPEG